MELRGSLALTGIGHGTNKAIRSDPEIKTGSTGSADSSDSRNMKIVEKNINERKMNKSCCFHFVFYVRVRDRQSRHLLRQACVLGLHGVTPAEVDPAQA